MAPVLLAFADADAVSLTHYTISSAPVLAAVVSPFLDGPSAIVE